MFGRKKKKSAEASTADIEEVKRPTIADADPIWSRPGPKDVSEVDTSIGYIDHGSLRIPAVEGLRIAPLGKVVDGKTAGIRMVFGTSLVEVEVFAAPRSGGVWPEMREALREMAQQMGAKVLVRNSRYGVEHFVEIPVELPDGGKGVTYIREIGHEGSRWVARIKLVGEAAADPKVAAPFEGLIDRIVVVRGPEPRARLEVLPVSFQQTGAFTVNMGSLENAQD